MKKKDLVCPLNDRNQIFSRQLITLFVCLILIFFWACDDNTYESPQLDPPTILIVDPDKADNQSLSDIVHDVEYIQLQLPSNEYIAEIKKAIFERSSIVILDSSPGGGTHKVFCFDQSGKFNFVIDKQGKGPGEYELIYDIDITDQLIVLSTPQKIMYYSLNTGEYMKSYKKPKYFDIQILGMLKESIVISDEGRYKQNKSKRQIKIIDLEKGESILDAVPFTDHAMKIGHTQRYIYRFNDTVSVVPMHDQTVYRVIEEGNKYSIKPAYKLDFGKYWIDEKILANSYNDSETFFNSQQKYVHTIDVFENEHLIYVFYRLQLKDYIYIYDKRSGKYLNISGFSSNNTGWTGLPVGTKGKSIVGAIAPWQIESQIVPNDKLKSILEQTEDEGHPILVKAQFHIK